MPTTVGPVSGMAGPFVSSFYTTDRPARQNSSSGCVKRAHVVLHPRGDEVRIVAHWEVVAAAHGELVQGREQSLPSRLKAQRVVELTENRQQRPVGQRSA